MNIELIYLQVNQILQNKSYLLIFFFLIKLPFVGAIYLRTKLYASISYLLTKRK